MLSSEYQMKLPEQPYSQHAQSATIQKTAPVPARKRGSLSSEPRSVSTVNGYFCPRMNTFFFLAEESRREDYMQAQENQIDTGDGSDIEHHAIWDMFQKILHEHGSNDVHIELKAIL